MGEPPAGGPAVPVQGLVSGLRRKVGDAVEDALPGLPLDPARLERDVDECDRLVAAARDSDLTGRTPALPDRGPGDAGEETPSSASRRPGWPPSVHGWSSSGSDLLEARSEAELALGNHRSLTTLLAPAVAENPFREQLAGLYITALYRSNRQADALAVYHHLRERLADELGSDVCAELRELYAQILRGEGCPATSVAARRTRREPGAARGRRSRGHAGGPPWSDRPSCRLRTGSSSAGPRSCRLWARRCRPGRRRGRCVVSGPGGLGKTAARRRVGPSGGYGVPRRASPPRPRAPARPRRTLVGAALVGLGVAPADVPSGLTDRIGLYRTVVRDRRLLVVADNAHSVEQVLALVPPGRQSQLVVTTRLRLVSLAAHHAVREIVLDPLDRAGDHRSARQLVGTSRLAVPATETLVEWCGGWPLLVRHVGAKLAARPSQLVTTFVGEVERSTDASLSDDPRSVEAALSSVHASLSPPAARLFERLALHSGVICLHLAAVAAGSNVHRVRRLLDELVGVHLLVETGSGSSASMTWSRASVAVWPVRRSGPHLPGPTPTHC